MTDHRVLRSLLATVVLAVLLVGVPLALLAWGRSPLDGSGSFGEQLSQLPTQTVSDHVIFGLLTIAAWAAWTLFAASFATEVAAALGFAARWRMPTPGPIQMGARRLVMSLMTGLTLLSPLSQRAGAIPELPSATAAATPVVPAGTGAVAVPLETQALAGLAGPGAAAPVLVLGSSPGDDEPDSSDQASAAVPQPVVVVAAGDTPWGLAERHLGNGVRWRDIWELNQGVTQADGSAWVEPDLIAVGWHLQLPHDATNLPDPPTRDPDGTDSFDAPDALEELEEPQDDASASDDAHGSGAAQGAETDASESEVDLEDEVAPQLPSQETDMDKSAAADTPTGSTAPGDTGDGSAPDEDETPIPDGSSPPPPDESADQDDTDDTAGGEPDHPPQEEQRRSEGNDGGNRAKADDDGTGTPSADTSGPIAPIAGLAGATALATGLVLALQRARRRQAVRSARGARRRGGSRSRKTERVLLQASDVPLVRWAGQALAEMVHRLDRSALGGAGPVAVELSEEHGIELLWDRPVADAVDPWVAVGQGWSWHLPYDPDAPVPADEWPCPIPALVTVGYRAGRQIMVDLEALGSLAVTGDPARVAELGSFVALELGANEDLADAYVSTVGFGLGIDDHFRRVQHATLDEAHTRLRSTADEVDRSLNEAGCSSSFEYRIGGHSHYLEANLVLASAEATELARAVPARRSVGAILLDPEHQTNTAAHIQISHDGTARLEPLGIEFHAAGIDAHATNDVINLLDTEAGPRSDEAADDLGGPADPGPGADAGSTIHHDAAKDPHSPVPAAAPAGPTIHEDRSQLPLIDPQTHPNGHASDPDDEPVVLNEIPTADPAGAASVEDHRVVQAQTSQDETLLGPNSEHSADTSTASTRDASGSPPSIQEGTDTSALGHPDLDEMLAGRLLVRVLGKPAVPDRPHLRRRAVTLTVFLACQDRPVAAEAMRHAIWNGTSRTDKTVWNLVAETRTGLGTFDDGEPVLARANKHHNSLQLSDRVTTDLALLRHVYEAAQTLPSSQAIRALSPALDLIHGQPFAGPGYEWAYEAQHAMEAEALIEDATLHLTELAVDTGQPDIAKEAIAAGFRGLPGNEPLVRARMRLEHDLGNNTGVHTAWQELQRFLDEIDTEPSGATTTLYTQLTRSTRN